jgi:putative ABC transport system ATP-binding protein
LFPGTILDNITYSIPGSPTSEQIDTALAQANVTSFLAEFPDGAQTAVGPRGAQLSGGQRQRIALARALLLNPPILILDESTSALDSKSEKVVAETLARRADDGLTTISIAHRVSTIKHSSRVIVLGKEGGVVETGSFAELKANKGSELNKLLAKGESGTGGDNAGGREMMIDALEELEIEEEILEDVEREIESGIKRDLSLDK